ncbi:MAG TPA: GNAT family N-acetyltransferase [Segeticoccus sp.]|uniref:GNAT family N-acetyltransferase n=1 Tax=Segeticoccus sp. TaxID=2706531 RepID=UPI002D808793|nr:GNAT family N-acetyltransferase [Segeticoccus sp.]HET8601346.1 GNAT family N-acetyltransferase [Segeticoccus sp.]
MPVLTRPRREDDIPELLDILARQQAQTQYPFHWPPRRSPERFLQRPTELEAWVAEWDGAVVGHVALQSVAGDELGHLWAGAHGVPVDRLRCISVLYADRRLPRRGIGSALLARATGQALLDGGAPCLDVVAGHLEPVNLYLSRGWVEIGRFRPEWLPDTEDPVHVMILPRRLPEGSSEPSARHTGLPAG